MKNYIIEKCQDGAYTKLFLKNPTDTDISLSDVCVASFPNSYIAESKIYGEGFTMLSQYTGTLNEVKCVGKYDDFRHYRLRKTNGYNAVYNMLIVQNGDKTDLYAFCSCHRFSGRIEWNDKEINMVLYLEGITIKAGQTIPLENILVLSSVDKSDGLEILSDCLAKAHNVTQFEGDVTGWCSWLCFGPDVSSEDILANTLAINRNADKLKYVQIDDGFQAHMGDWLTISPQFGSMEDTLDNIRKHGAEPAIWVAPFIADKDSELLRNHPDYFVKDDNGAPLCSSDFTFGGWRCAPWYMLDGSNPDACSYIEHVFSTMRKKWGIKYFKLDANCWGAFSNGKRFDESCTPVEAYRRGMQALRRGAGEGAIILGCNAPMWPSIGEVNAMRVSGDMCRQWRAVKMLTAETCGRIWTNKLWRVDPDVLTLKAQTVNQLMPDGTVVKRVESGLDENETDYHKCAIFAASGSLLSGDDLSKYQKNDFEILKLFLDEKHSPAVFRTLDLSVGYMEGDGCSYAVVFNKDDTPAQFKVDCRGKKIAYDVFKNMVIGECNDSITVTVDAHCGRLIKFTTGD